jgi:hypothetical protein
VEKGAVQKLIDDINDLLDDLFGKKKK